MRILDRYIRANVIWSTFLVVLILLGIESFIEFIGELPLLGTHKYGILAVFTYVSMQLPADLYQLFPIAGFIGSLIGLGRLASTSELIVIRAAGVSVARIIWAVIKAALWMIIVVTIIGEWQAPSLQYKSIQIKEARLMRTNLWSQQGLWIHQDNSFVHIEKVVSKEEVKNVTRFDFDKTNHLLEVLQAKQAVLVKGAWQLQDISGTKITPTHSEVFTKSELPLDFSFEPQLLQKKMQTDALQQSFVSLWKNINYRQASGLTTQNLESAFWQRLMQPLTTIVMICLGIPFIFGSLRSASMSSRILTGIIVGFIFYIINQFLGPFTMVYQWPTWIAGISPTILFLLIFAFLLARSR